MIYKCTNCGYLYNDDKVGVKFVDLADSWGCSVCSAQKTLFVPVDETVSSGKHSDVTTAIPIEGDSSLIQQMALSGKTAYEPGGTDRGLVSWDDVLLMGAGLAHKPLEADAEVNTRTVIGRLTHQPMELETPIMISHMSLGALSHDSKIALAKASAMAGTSIGSGEGGILSAEFDRAHKYILEYTPNQYGVTDDNLRRADAIEIKMGQAARPGMGSQLSADKATGEAAALRGAKAGQAVSGPASFHEINEPWDLLLMVKQLRERSGGRPIGIKMAAGNIEEDLKWVQHAGPDFVTIDGHGGGTGSGPVNMKAAMGTPTLYALYRTRKFIDDNKLNIDIVVTGGLRTSADFIKALALGADAVAIATATLIALAAQGSITPEKKVANFINVSNEELKAFARSSGYDDVHLLSAEDLATISSEISEHTNIRHA